MTATTIASRAGLKPCLPCPRLQHRCLGSRGLSGSGKLRGLLRELREIATVPGLQAVIGLANALRLNKVRLGSSLAALSSGHRWSLHSTVQRVYPCLLSLLAPCLAAVDAEPGMSAQK
jgi:hypothetical protein